MTDGCLGKIFVMSFWLGQLSGFLQGCIWFASLKHLGIFNMHIPTRLKSTDFFFLNWPSSIF